MDDEKQAFQEDLISRNDPVEGWSTKRLKKEVEGNSGVGQAQERDDLGIE